MLDIKPLLDARLTALPALSGWQVRHGRDLEDRSVVPAATYACRGATPQGQRKNGLMLEPVWAVTLTHKRTTEGESALATALTDVIESLHGWKPEVPSGARGWEPLQLRAITEPEFFDAGLIGYVLSFTTAGLYRGQN